MTIPSSTHKKLRTTSSVREKQDHYVNSSRVSSRICHINITPSNKKCKLLYICCNWKLYHTLVESPIYLITISSHKISFRKVECNSGEVAIGISIMELCLDWDLSKVWDHFCCSSGIPYKFLELSIAELTNSVYQLGRRHEISQHSWPCV